MCCRVCCSVLELQCVAVCVCFSGDTGADSRPATGCRSAAAKHAATHAATHATTHTATYTATYTATHIATHTATHTATHISARTATRTVLFTFSRTMHCSTLLQHTVAAHKVQDTVSHFKCNTLAGRCSAQCANLSSSFAEYRLFCRALLQKRPAIVTNYNLHTMQLRGGYH